jgi:sugar phosphate isomerase/epimerase
MKAYDESRMHIVFVADAPVKRHAFECVKYLTQSSESDWWREYYEGRRGSDYRICLVHRDDIRATFFPSERTEIRCRGGDYERRYVAARDQLLRGRDRMSRTWCWCVAGYDPDSRIDVLWVFDASLETQRLPGWLARLDVSGDVKLAFAGESPPTVGTGGTDGALAEGTPAKTHHGSRRLSSPLTVSVLTSCSDLPLSTLFQQLQEASVCTLFDLFVLRDIDIREIEHLYGPLNPAARRTPDDRSIALIMADNDNYARILAWLLAQFGMAREVKIAALATYFPDISSVSTSRRDRAVDALTNTVRLAIELKKRGFMATPIVELVCGSKLDRCDCDECRGERIWEYQEKDKIGWLLHSLRTVKCRVGSEFPSEQFALALELEPGETYVLHDENSLSMLAETVLADKEGLARYCGLNVDIAHMRAAEVAPTVLKKYTQLIAHVHICDLPFRMHTRDQPVGRWCPLDTAHSHHWEYLDVVALRRPGPESNTELPFSGAVAIELEGCARANWIYESVARLREMIVR